MHASQFSSVILASAALLGANPVKVLGQASFPVAPPAISATNARPAVKSAVIIRPYTFFEWSLAGNINNPNQTRIVFNRVTEHRRFEADIATELPLPDRQAQKCGWQYGVVAAEGEEPRSIWFKCADTPIPKQGEKWSWQAVPFTNVERRERKNFMYYFYPVAANTRAYTMEYCRFSAKRYRLSN